MLKDINKKVEDFKTKRVQIVPGLYFSQNQTLEDIFFYYNSKFRTGEIDDEGDKKYFFNIVKNPCKVFSKAIDFDTKNIRLLTADGGDTTKTWFMERDFKYWMRDKQFGKVLNRIFYEIPIYGTVVLKIVDGTPYFVDLRNFVVEQSADTLNDSSYIIEVHNHTVDSFRKIAKQMGWKQSDIDETIALYRKMKDTSHIRIYEYYGEVEDDDGKFEYRRVFYADVGVDEFDQYGNLKAEKPGVKLSSEKWEGHPYWEFHAEKMPGRWLGIGVVESLFEPQISENERTNLQAKASFWAALRVFQTRDPAVQRNLLTNTMNGEVLNVDSEITPINMEDRSLAFFNDQHNKWMRNRDELTFAYDVIQGERLPAGTPLGSAQLAVSQSLSYFEQIQESIALDIKEMIYQVIIPQFEKEQSTEHTLRIVGKDLEVYTKMVTNKLVMEEIIRQLASGRAFPDETEKEKIEIAITESIKQDKEKLLTIPRGFYRNNKYDIDIDITGESVDTRVRSATRFAILQAITADPTMVTDPTKKKILYGMAEDGGINPNELFEIEQPKQIQDVENRRAGGGVSSPAIGQQIPGVNQQTV